MAYQIHATEDPSFCKWISMKNSKDIEYIDIESVSNEALWERPIQEPIEHQIRRKEWSWKGYTLRKPTQRTTRLALTWNHQGKGKREG